MIVKVSKDPLSAGSAGFIIYSRDDGDSDWSEELIPPSVGDAALHNRLNELGYPTTALHARLLNGETVPSPSQK